MDSLPVSISRQSKNGNPVTDIHPPAPRPCESCPYRTDVPAGIWAAEEYERLGDYDAATGEQPAAVFLCHQYDHEMAGARICGGWAGCHDTENLLALRLALATGSLDARSYQQIIAYESPTDLFDSGAEAADHGLSGIAAPDGRARAAIAKIRRRRGI